PAPLPTSVAVFSWAIATAEPSLSAVRTDLQQRPITRRARPARGIARIAQATVAGFLGKLTERHRPRDSQRWIIVHILGGDDLFGWNAVLDPVFQRSQRIEGIGSGAAAAMQLTGRHEQSGMLLHVTITAEQFGQVLIERDRAVRRHPWIAVSVLEEHLVTAR